MRKFSLMAAFAAVMTLGVMTAASAQLTAIANTGGNGSAPFITFDSTTGLSLLTGSIPNDGYINGKVGQGSDPNATISLTMGSASPTLSSYDSGTGAFSQAMSGGSFVVTDYTTHAILLQGSFGASTLSGNTGSGSISDSLNLNSLTFGGTGGAGSLFPAGFSLNNGTLSLEMTTSTNPTVTTNPITHTSTLGDFSATDQITIDAVKNSAVPEPASFATFGIGALVMLAMGLAAKRRSLVVRAL